MKKINKNAVVFIAIILIISIGYLKLDFIGSIRNALFSFINNVKVEGVFDSAKALTNNIDKTSSEQLSYHDLCVNVNSLFLRGVNTRIIKKDDETIVKMNNGMLAEEVAEIPYSSIKTYAQNIKELQDKTGVPVIYVMAPQKGYNGGLPSNADNYIKHNCDNLVKELEGRNVDYLDLRQCMDEQKLTIEDSFFATDHHWKPLTGLWATNEIAQKLNSDYDFNYESSLFNIDNYNSDTYKNIFLGSEGRKTGIYFTKYGLENFDVIYPKFSTNLTVTNKIKNTKVSGDFKNTVLNLEHLNYTTPYESWLYSTYSDGDNAVQVIDNKNLPNGKTALVIRDSFAGVVTPFLSLNFKSLHVLDLREDVIGTERVNSVSKYAKEIKPDYILIIYKTVKTDECYKFN